MIGKTIIGAVHEHDTYGALYLTFSDGTHVCISGEGYETGEVEVESVSLARVREIEHEAQGDRETARMRRLHAMLHPRDKQWLEQRARKLRERQLAKASPTIRAFDSIITESFRDMQGELNRASYLTLMSRQPPSKRKHRPRKAPQFLDTGTFVVPVKKRA